MPCVVSPIGRCRWSLGSGDKVTFQTVLGCFRNVSTVCPRQFWHLTGRLFETVLEVRVSCQTQILLNTETTTFSFCLTGQVYLCYYSLGFHKSEYSSRLFKSRCPSHCNPLHQSTAGNRQTGKFLANGHVYVFVSWIIWGLLGKRFAQMQYISV